MSERSLDAIASYIAENIDIRMDEADMRYPNPDSLREGLLPVSVSGKRPGSVPIEFDVSYDPANDVRGRTAQASVFAQATDFAATSRAAAQAFATWGLGFVEAREIAEQVAELSADDIWALDEEVGFVRAELEVEGRAGRPSKIAWEEPKRRGDMHTQRGTMEDGCAIYITSVENHRATVEITSADDRRGVGDYVHTQSAADGLVNARALAESLYGRNVDILTGIKSMRGWEASGLSLSGYVGIGDRVGRDMVDHFRDALPPATNRRNMVQMGEAIAKQVNPLNDRFETTYATFANIGSPDAEWVYAGNCFKGSLAPNIEALAKAYPDNPRLLDALAALRAAVKGKPLQKAAERPYVSGEELPRNADAILEDNSIRVVEDTQALETQVGKGAKGNVATEKAPTGKGLMDKFIEAGGWDGPWETQRPQISRTKTAQASASPGKDLKSASASAAARKTAPHNNPPAKRR